MGRKRKKKKRKPTAATADRHALYQYAVQDAKAEIAFLRQVYREAGGRRPRHLREDFCGTALVAACWARRGRTFTAEGYDIDPEPIEWGQAHNFEPGEFEEGRCRLFVEDVREPSRKRPDLRCALNFSYRAFKSRPVLLDYFRRVRDDLAEGGVFVLDTHGGPDSYMEMTEVRPIRQGFTYAWEQVEFWPGTGDYECRIHFSFPDGTSLRDAFVYDWRFWSIPELTDALREAGFSRVTSYWEGTDEDGETGNGVFSPDERGENCMAWIAYVVACR